MSECPGWMSECPGWMSECPGWMSECPLKITNANGATHPIIFYTKRLDDVKKTSPKMGHSCANYSIARVCVHVPLKTSQQMDGWNHHFSAKQKCSIKVMFGSLQKGTCIANHSSLALTLSPWNLQLGPLFPIEKTLKKKTPWVSVDFWSNCSKVP